MTATIPVITTKLDGDYSLAWAEWEYPGSPEVYRLHLLVTDEDADRPPYMLYDTGDADATYFDTLHEGVEAFYRAVADQMRIDREREATL